MNRKHFIKSLGLTAGAAAIAGGISARPGYSKKSAFDPLLDGVIDLHVHGSPDTRPRVLDELQFAQQAKQAGYRAVLYKANDWSSHDRAYLIREVVPDFEVFGGICMNFVHGDKVNVYAAEQALKTTGNHCRCIWMPTGAAAFHHRQNNLEGKGIPVIDERGQVLPEVVRVMEICAEADIMVASGHSSSEESIILAKKAKELGWKKFVVTHVNSIIWKMTADQIKRVTDLGGYVEYCYLPRLWGPGTGNPDMPRQSREEKLFISVKTIRLIQLQVSLVLF